MNNNENHKGGGFSNAFLWGFIIGGAVVFLLGTEKGRKFLKTITDEGIGNLSDLMEEGIEEYEEIDDEEIPVARKTNGNGVSKKEIKEEIVKEEKPSVRKRFFKRK